MSFTKKKKLLLIGIPIGVVVVATVIMLCYLFLPKEEESTMSLAVKSDGNYDPNQTTYIILNGFDWREDYPNTLAFYSFALPEGYTHTVNAETSANRFSTGYTDQYQTPEGGTLEFYQTLASSNWSFSREGDFQEMTYAGNPVVCYHGEDRSAVFWLYGDSILTFSADWPMEDNQLLELVSRVDYENLRQPVYSPWEFQWGSFAVVPDETNDWGYNYSTQWYEITGNPEIPEEMFCYGFDQPPEGFVKNQHVSEANSSNSSYAESYYQDESGRRETLNVFNTIWARTFFNDIQGEDLNNHDLVQDITVQGNQGWYHQSDTGAELVFVTDYLIVDMVYEGQITQEEMLALAESLVQKPMEETSSTLSSE